MLAVRGGGFVTRELIDDALRRFHEDGGVPHRLLIDVRDVAGYDRNCGPVARDLLARAHNLGVRRIAFVASSRVLRTATALVAGRSLVDLRAFEHPASARRWLDVDAATSGAAASPP